jgi:hypothetical protein
VRDVTSREFIRPPSVRPWRTRPIANRARSVGKTRSSRPLCIKRTNNGKPATAADGEAEADSDDEEETSSSDCQACAQASSCPARTSGSSHQRSVLRNLDQDVFEEVQARMRDPTFGEKLSERIWKMEGRFAEAKRNHGRSRARYRGRTKVQIQAYLSAIVQNLKRLVAALSFWFTIWRLSRRQMHNPDHPPCQNANFFNKPDR